MNILFCSTAFKDGINGSGRFAREMLHFKKSFPEANVDILTESVDADPKHHVYSVKHNQFTRVPVLTYYAKSVQYAHEAQRLLARTKYDVVLFNNLWLAAMFVKTIPTNVKTGAFIRDEMTLLDKNELSARPGIFWSMKMRRYLERKAIKHLDRILVNSTYLKKKVAGAYHQEPDRIEIVRSAFNDYRDIKFKFNPLEGGKEVRVLFVKANVFRGGLRDLMEALRILKDYKFRLTVVGPTEDEVRKLANEVEMGQHVNLEAMGLISLKEKVFQVMRTHHILCIPARWEALGVANAEGAVCGLRVVSTNVGGIPEVVHPDYSKLVEPREEKAIAKAIATFIVEPQDIALENARKHREYIIAHYGRDKMLLRLNEILQRMVSTSKSEG